MTGVVQKGAPSERGTPSANVVGGKLAGEIIGDDGNVSSRTALIICASSFTVLVKMLPCHSRISLLR